MLPLEKKILKGRSARVRLNRSAPRLEKGESRCIYGNDGKQ